MQFANLVDLYPILYKIIVCCTAPAAIGFPIWYHFRLRWRDSPMGRHVMGYSIVVGLLYLTTLLRLFFPGMPAQRGITLTLIVGMMIVVWWRVVVFVRIYHETHRERLVREQQERLDRDMAEDESIQP